MELTQAQWDALAAAEAPLYRTEGINAYTSVMAREGDDYIAGLWENAWSGASAIAEGSDDEIEIEVARRVAAAQAILAFGVEFGSEIIAGGSAR